jgi:hypothetical protein
VISPLNHPVYLHAWCYLWEGNAADCSRSLEDAELDQAIVDYAATFLGAAANRPLQRTGRRPAAKRQYRLAGGE